MTITCINNGTGTITAKMGMYEKSKIIPTKIHPVGSIGMHKQDSGDDINYVLSGTGKAIFDGEEEILTSGCCHIFPQGSEHRSSIPVVRTW
jgi:mannose-6-phosphate isomerase-like protein (cupin superfamily)